MDEKNGKDIRVKVHYSNFHFGNKKILGKALILNNAILVSNEIYKNDETVYDYVVSHEEGHLKDFLAHFVYNTRICLISVLSLLPLILYYLLNSLVFALMPTILYIAVVIFFRRRIDKKIEFNADIYALKDIGKEKVVFALELLSYKENEFSLKNKGMNFSKRLERINEYIKKTK